MPGRPTKISREQKQALADKGFSSIAACAKAHGMAASTLSHRLRSGLSLDEALTATSSEIHLQGASRPALTLTKAQREELQKYGRSVRQLAQEYGLSESTVFRRLHKGWTVKKALEMPSRNSGTKLTLKQQDELWSDLGFSSLRAAVIHYDMPYGLVRDRWLRLGWDLERALTTPAGPTKPGT